MKKQIALLFVCLFASFAVAAIAEAQQPQAQRQTPLMVAVVDMPSVIKAHPITTDTIPQIQQSFQKEVLEAQKYEQTCQKQVDQIKQEFKYGTPQFEQAVKPIKDGLRQAQVQLQDKQAEVMSQANQLQYKVFTDIQQAVQQVALQKQAIIVLTKIKLERNGVAEEVAAVQEADANALLVWSRPECDITEEVKAALEQIAGVSKTNGGALANISGQIQASAPTGGQGQQRQATAAAPQGAGRLQ